MVKLKVEKDDFPAWVELLGDPVRAKRACWHLVMGGDAARSAIRSGLNRDNPDVRMYCAKALDHLVDEESFPHLVTMLDDPDPRVRWDTLHALACDRCKDSDIAHSPTALRRHAGVPRHVGYRDSAPFVTDVIVSFSSAEAPMVSPIDWRMASSLRAVLAVIGGISVCCECELER